MQPRGSNVPSGGRAKRRPAALGPIALCFILGAGIGGITIAPGVPGVVVSRAASRPPGSALPEGVQLLVACACLAAGLGSRRAQHGVRLGLLCGAACGIGFLLAAKPSRQQHPRPVVLEGVLAATPTAVASSGAALADAFPVEPRTRLEVESGHGLPAFRVRTSVFTAGAVHGRPGDSVRIQGIRRAYRNRANPGTMPPRHGTFVAVPDPALVRLDEVVHPGWLAQLRRARESVRRRTLETLRASHDGTAPEREAILAALLLGHRAPAFDAAATPFRLLGVAHVLAISGLHLAVVLGIVLSIAGCGADRRMRRSGVALLTVAAYLAVVDARPPVVRAAVMACIAAAGGAGRRRWTAEGLLALAAITLVLRDPAEALRPGFQLSFVVVLALVRLAPSVRARWLGPPQALTAAPRAIAGQRLRDGAAIALTAWAVATPLTMHHFGIVSPLGAAASLVLAPTVAPALAAGYLAVAVSCVAPELGAAVMRCVGTLTGAAMTLAEHAAGVPGTWVRVAPPGIAWTAAALAWVWAAFSGARLPRRRTALSIAALVLATTWTWPRMSAMQPPLRIEAIDVGPGSCLLVRSAGAAFLFDAGARSAPGIGRSIVPALRRLGVHRLDAIAVSHGHLDHFGAVPEVLQAFGPCPVLLTEHMLRAAARHPDGPEAALLAWLDRADARVELVEAGDCRTLGAARLDWLHPASGDRFGGRNDESMVVAIDAGGVRGLLCGDIGPEGIAAVRRRSPELRADIVEVPHHGSDEPAAEAWLASMSPRVALQSCGARRVARGVVFRAPDGCVHLVTAIDGACGAVITRRATLRTWAVRRTFVLRRTRVQKRPTRGGAQPPSRSAASSRFSITGLSW